MRAEGMLVELASSSLVKQPGLFSPHVYVVAFADGKPVPTFPANAPKAPPALMTTVRGQALHLLSLFPPLPKERTPPAGGWSAETAL
jgi:hypothetical protein